MFAQVYVQLQLDSYVCMYACMYLHMYMHIFSTGKASSYAYNQNNHSHHGRKMDGGQQLIAYAISCISQKRVFHKVYISF